MKRDYFQRFQKVINHAVYRCAQRDDVLEQPINEETYQLVLKFTVDSEAAVAFRIEDVKAKAQYLIGEQRAAGKDNDCTLIDDAIYQIEIKKRSHLKKAHVGKQFAGGEQWLRHLLWLVASGDQTRLAQLKALKSYNLVILIPTHQRGMSRNRDHYQLKWMDDHYQVRYVDPHIKWLDLTNIKRTIGNEHHETYLV